MFEWKVISNTSGTYNVNLPEFVVNSYVLRGKLGETMKTKALNRTYPKQVLYDTG